MADPKYLIGVPMYVGDFVPKGPGRGDIVANSTKSWRNIGHLLIVATMDQFGEIIPAFGLEERGAQKLAEIAGGGVQIRPVDSPQPPQPTGGAGSKGDFPVEPDPGGGGIG